MVGIHVSIISSRALIWDQRISSSRLTTGGVSVLRLLLRCFKWCLVPVLPRKARPDMVEKLWTGTFMSPAKSSASVMPEEVHSRHIRFLGRTSSSVASDQDLYYMITYIQFKRQRMF